MSATSGSGRPTRHVTMHEGQAPKPTDGLLKRFLDGSDPENEAPKRTTKAAPTPPKASEPDWRTKLPAWLRQSEPAERKSMYWHKWNLYSRLNFRGSLEDNEKKGEKISVPVFRDYVEGFRQNTQYSLDTRRHSETKVVVANASGGVSKTTVATLLAAQRSRATGMNVILYDGDSSDPNALEWYVLEDATDRSELPDAPDVDVLGESLDDIVDSMTPEVVQGGVVKELTTVELNRRLVEDQWQPTYNELLKLTASDADSKVWVIHAERGKRLTAAQTTQNIDALTPHCHTLIADTQPGTEDDEHATSALVAGADILIVPGFADTAKTLNAVSTTLNYAPYNLRTEKGRVAGHVLIVISGVKPRNFNARTRLSFAKRYNAAVQQVILIPHDDYLKGQGDFTTTNKIDIDALEPRTQYGVSYLDQTVSRLAIRLNRRRENQKAYDELHMPPAGAVTEQSGKTSDEEEVYAIA